MSGWAIGYIIGGAVVVVVVAVLLTMIALAKSIADRGQSILAALETAQENTAGLWSVRTTNTVAGRIVEAATAARESLEGR